ncbi:GtrA family protein [Paenibacillus filicis]|uniref:GtrA family protein n=1 Tax=Paenibacillus gyeongsangnamensis TaxID=3388067 RepID=A0ABT4Q9B5_9BACL|nr:GtrA family protein [Paenibacillus filicis]MCZ8513295.1 GtrA family protein [Paenibacillus filicis]
MRKCGGFKQLVRFGVTGAVNTLIDLLVFATLAQGFGWNTLLSQVLSYISGTANSFMLNKYWTFELAGKPALPEAGKFAAVNVLSLSVSSFVLYGCNRQLGWEVMASKLAATGCALAVNFAGSRFWVFRTNHSIESGDVHDAVHS